VLFDNKDKTVTDDQPAIYLKSYYQPRDDDYKAFVVFPVPWPRRSQSTRYVKGAIHISFRTEKEFDELWKNDDDPVVTDKRYHSEERMLGEWCQDDMVRAALSTAIVVLGELLRGFNENLFLASRAV
jgi:hypothetical protein